MRKQKTFVDRFRNFKKKLYEDGKKRALDIKKMKEDAKIEANI